MRLDSNLILLGNDLADPSSLRVIIMGGPEYGVSTLSCFGRKKNSSSRRFCWETPSNDITILGSWDFFGMSPKNLGLWSRFSTLSARGFFFLLFAAKLSSGNIRNQNPLAPRVQIFGRTFIYM